MDGSRNIADIQTAPQGDFGELVKVRKFVIHIEEVLHEFGPAANPPQLKGYIAAVAANPYAGRYVENLMPLMEALKPLGTAMAQRLIDALGGADKIVAYGKSAIVGENGELEHAALWHEPGGYGAASLWWLAGAAVATPL